MRNKWSSFVLSGISRGKVKNEKKSSRVFKKAPPPINNNGSAQVCYDNHKIRNKLLNLQLVFEEILGKLVFFVTNISS